MYFLLPLWLAAGFADWLCHRATHIEATTGAKESLIHLLMFAEVSVPLLAAIFLEVNALVIGLAISHHPSFRLLAIFGRVGARITREWRTAHTPPWQSQ
jgi:hypothetical protein